MKEEFKTIFIVDDSDVNLITAEKALAKHYNVFTLQSAEDMFKLLNKIIPIDKKRQLSHVHSAIITLQAICISPAVQL